MLWLFVPPIQASKPCFRSTGYRNNNDVRGTPGFPLFCGKNFSWNYEGSLERESFWPFTSLNMNTSDYMCKFPALLNQVEKQDNPGQTRLHTILHQFYK